MEGTCDKGLEMCACQSSKAWWLGGVDRQFVKNIPQMTLNPWWHEIHESDSPGFFSFNYMVLCDYHKYQSIVHTWVFLCVPLFLVHLLVTGHNACRAPDSSNSYQDFEMSSLWYNPSYIYNFETGLTEIFFIVLSVFKNKHI